MADTMQSLADFLLERNARLVPVPSGSPLTERFTFVQPEPWVRAAAGIFPSLAAAFVVHSPNHTKGWSPNATLALGVIPEDLAENELLEASMVDARALPDWREEVALHDTWLTCSATSLEGTYRIDGLELETLSRFAVVPGTDVDRFLLQWTVTVCRESPDVVRDSARQLFTGLAYHSI